MFATTNMGQVTIKAPAGGLKNGQPVYLSDDLAGVSQSDYAEGAASVVLLTGIECVVTVTGISADVPAYTRVDVQADGDVVINDTGANVNGQAKLGVIKFAIDAQGGDNAGPVEATQRVKIIVQGI